MRAWLPLNRGDIDRLTYLLGWSKGGTGRLMEVTAEYRDFIYNYFDYWPVNGGSTVVFYAMPL